MSTTMDKKDIKDRIETTRKILEGKTLKEQLDLILKHDPLGILETQTQEKNNG